MSWWDTEGTDCTIIQPVEAIAVYTNQNDHIVIRQQDSLGGEDSLVVLPKDQVRRIIEALEAEISE